MARLFALSLTKRVNFCKLIFFLSSPCFKGKLFPLQSFSNFRFFSLCANSICMIKLNFFSLTHSLAPSLCSVLHFTNSWTSSISECTNSMVEDNFLCFRHLFYVYISENLFFSLSVMKEEEGRSSQFYSIFPI